MPTRNVVLTQRHDAMIENLIREGRYESANEIMSAALRLLEQRDAEDEARLKLLREAAQVGLEAIAAGRFTDFETPEELEEYISELTRTAITEQEG